MFWLFFGIFLSACAAAAATGALFETGAWYRSLTKPSWNPPDWVFPLAWTSIYLCISVAGARVALSESNVLALSLFALQFPINTLWTPVFFGLRRMGAAFVIVIAMWIAVAASTVAFFAVDFWAGMLMMPYLAWVTIASALNWSIWRLNPGLVPLKPSEL